MAKLSKETDSDDAGSKILIYVNGVTEEAAAMGLVSLLPCKRLWMCRPRNSVKTSSSTQSNKAAVMRRVRMPRGSDASKTFNIQ